MNALSIYFTTDDYNFNKMKHYYKVSTP